MTSFCYCLVLKSCPALETLWSLAHQCPLSMGFPRHKYWSGSHFLWFLFSHSVMSDSLWPHGSQQSRLPCPSPSPRVCSNSCSLSRGCYPTISSSVVPFSSCLQFFLASGPLPVSQLFSSGGQSIAPSTSVLPMNFQSWFPLGLTGLIFLQSKGFSRVLQHYSAKALIFWCSAFFIVQLSHLHMSFPTPGELPSPALAKSFFTSKCYQGSSVTSCVCGVSDSLQDYVP